MDTTKVKPPIVLSRIGQRFARVYVDLGIRQKMVLSAALGAVLLGAVGWVGLQRMDSLRLTVLGLQRDMTGLSSVKETNINLLAMLGAAQVAGQQTDPALVDFQQQAYAYYAPVVREQLARADSSLADSASHAKIDEVQALIGTFESAGERVFALAKSGDQKGATAAVEEMNGQSQSLAAMLTEVAVSREVLGQQALDKSRAMYVRGRLLMLGLVIGGVLSVVLIGLASAMVLTKPLQNTVRVLECLGRGDLSQDPVAESRDEMGRMTEVLSQAIRDIRHTLADVRGSADEVAQSSAEFLRGAELISAGAQSQASSLEETVCSLTTVSESMQENARQAEETCRLAGEARASAQRGGEVVVSAVASMRELLGSSNRIKDISTTIDELAFQTNLLALNAAVEAARAGDQGRGFAVVAGEVRLLAQRSAGASREIRTLIQESVQRIESSSGLVERSGQRLEEIVGSVQTVTDTVNAIAQASRDHVTSFRGLQEAIEHASKVTESNAAQSEELEGASRSLLERGDHLRDLVARFNLGNTETEVVDDDELADAA